MDVRVDKKIDNIWTQNKVDFNRRLSNWAKALSCGQEVSVLAKEKFHQWEPLRTYISVSKAGSVSRALYSVRFYGQEVANLIVENQDAVLRLDGHAKKNEHWFGVSIKDGKYPWRGPEAKGFRSDFKKLARIRNGFPNVRSPEHRVETKFIAEMRKGSGKFSVPGLEIKPVMIAGKFPLQVPIPISANTGMPEPGNGYIDILARRKAEDNKVRLSVWELKKPKEYKHAVFQAYIYAYTLLKILRQSDSRKDWYKLFGFRSEMPSSLTIESVVAITEDQQRKYLKEQTLLLNSVPLNIGQDHIELYVAHYEECPDSIKLKRNPFVEKICSS